MGAEDHATTENREEAESVVAPDEDLLVLDEEPSPPDAVLPVWEPTGNAQVDAALEELHALTAVDVSDHADVYERVQASLRSTLDGLAAEDEAV